MTDMSGKSLTWSFRMQPLKCQWAEVFASKDEVQYKNARSLAAMLEVPDFKSECRSALFEAINRELNASFDPRTINKLKV